MTTLRLLTDGDLDRVHDAALRVLFEVGARIMTEEGRALLVDHGGRVEGEVVRIPPELVERALAVAPSRFAIFDRGGEPALHLGEGNVYVGPASRTSTTWTRTPARSRTSTSARRPSRRAWPTPSLDFVATPGVTGPWTSCRSTS